MKDGLIGVIRKNADKVRFHTPSHAGRLYGNIAEWDVTELNYTDNLLSPSSYLSALEKNIASAYGAEACFISAQGATGSVFQAVFATKNDGAFLVVGKAHCSVFNALRVLGCKARHVDSFSADMLVPADVKTIIVTSPDYFGNVLPLSDISDFAKIKGLTLIVDSSHGAHFAFSDKLPVSASELADLVIFGLHKTLPVMTGGSVLCVREKFREKCVIARKLLHSTSPSFAVLCSVEKAFDDYTKNGNKYYDNVIREIENFKKGLKDKFRVKNTDDVTRLVLMSEYDGKAVEKALFERGFVAECVSGSDVVFIVNPNNFRYLKKLLKAVNGLNGLPLYEERNFPCKAHAEPVGLYFGKEAEGIDVALSVGRRAFCEVGFYPPGVPLIYSGDVITDEHLAVLTDEKFRNNVFGLDRGKIFVLK